MHDVGCGIAPGARARPEGVPGIAPLDLPDRPVNAVQEQLPRLRDLAPGNYELAVAIVTPETQAPAIRLAIGGRSDDNWYPVSHLRVSRWRRIVSLPSLRAHAPGRHRPLRGSEAGAHEHAGALGCAPAPRRRHPATRHDAASRERLRCAPPIESAHPAAAAAPHPRTSATTVRQWSQPSRRHHRWIGAQEPRGNARWFAGPVVALPLLCHHLGELRVK